MAFRILLSKSFKGISGSDYSIVHQSWPSWGSIGDKSIEVVDSLSKSTLIVDYIVEKEERDNMFKVVSDGSVGKSLEKWLNCSYSFEIGLIEESAAHRSWNIEEHGNGFFWISGYHRFEVFLIDDLFHIFARYIRAHQIQIDSLLFSSDHVVYIIGFSNIFIFAHKNSQFSLFCLQQQVSSRFVFNLKRLMHFHIHIGI